MLALVFCWAIPLDYVFVFYAVTLFPEVVRVTFIGVRERVVGARIIALGWLLFVAGTEVTLSLPRRGGDVERS